MVTFFVPVQLPVCTVRMSTVDVFQNAGSLTVRRNIACGSSVRQREPEVFVSDGVHLLRLFFFCRLWVLSLNSRCLWTHTKKKGKNRDQRVFPDEICCYCAKPLSEDEVNKALVSLGLRLILQKLILEQNITTSDSKKREASRW